MERSLFTSFLILLFAPAAHAAEPTSLLTFDYRTVQLRQVDSHWQLWAGNALLKDLGASGPDAREALALIRTLKLSQRGAIGTRAPVLEYWLADGKAPRGLIPSHRLQPIDRGTLRAEQLEGQWCIRDIRQVWFNFGRFESDARQALALFERYPFNRVGYIGSPTPILIYFLEAPDAPAAHPSQLPAVYPPINPLQLWQTQQLTAVNPLAFNAATGEERESFDWRRAELRREGTSWKLVVGRETLADFGGRESDAREALRTIQYYRFTERCEIGASAMPFVYYLVNGQAPRGLRFGFRNTSFAPDRLGLRQLDGCWMICEGERPILHGGASEADAKQVLQAIQRYKFDNWCEMSGSDQGGLSFLVRER